MLRNLRYPSLVLIACSLGCEPSVTQRNEPVVAKPSAEPVDIASTSVSSGTGDGAAPPPVATKTLFVREVLAECEGAGGPRKCMQVRESERDEWTLFYGAIEGFKYEPSFAYELRVTVESVSKPPADGSSRRYRLAEVVSKAMGPTR